MDNNINSGDDNALFEVTLLPARYGDGLWIRYGTKARPHHILIDGGTRGTASVIEELLQELPEDRRVIDLLVVTHLDRDHIEGILALLEPKKLSFKIDEIWFNGWPQLIGKTAVEAFGARQAEELSARILAHGLCWNEKFEGKAVIVPEQGDLPEIILPGGLELILLSPFKKNLEELVPVWEEELRKLNLEPGYGVQQTPPGVEAFGGINIEELNELCFHEDDSAGNGSSIAFIAQYAGKRCLFAGDALPSVILAALNRKERGYYPVDLFKVSHHASAHNTSPDLLDKAPGGRYAISTNGSIYSHPSRETMARVIKRTGAGQELVFNYRTKFTDIWEEKDLRRRYRYRTRYPDGEGITINILEKLKDWDETEFGLGLGDDGPV